MRQVLDANQLNRVAQPIIAEYRRVTPYGYGGDWHPLYDTRVEFVTLRSGDKFNTARLFFPMLRWQQWYTALTHGTNIRIRTIHKTPTVLFQGFITNYPTRFSGGNSSAAPHEGNYVDCKDYRWLVSRSSPMFGIVARSQDDYTSLSPAEPTPTRATWFSGRRCVFNEAGKPNRDDILFSLADYGYQVSVPIFASDFGSTKKPWTIRQMLDLLLSPLYNKSHNLFPLLGSASLVGSSHTGLDRVVNSITCDTDDIVTAAVGCLKHIGFSIAEHYDLNGPYWTVYKSSAAAGTQRSQTQPNILHTLHAPAVGEKITDAVARGEKLVWGGEFDEDIDAVINAPIGLGGVHRFEFTAELVPAWKDTDFTVPDAAGSYEAAFVTEADLQASATPDDYDFYKYYHAQGSQFKSDVGRKWALNEAGDYTAVDYDRGMPFDWATVLPADRVYDAAGRRLFGLFRRAFLDPLSFDAQSLNSVGLKVEVSFDGGTSWHPLQWSGKILKGECAIRFEDPNLSELLDPAGRLVSGTSTDLDGKELNYFTSLCRDKLAGSSFKDGQWQTRVRVTASVQMDQRLYYQSPRTSGSGSPFAHARCFDFSDRYSFSKRADSSTLTGPAWDTDEYTKLTDHLDALREANQDMSINGRFTLDRLWLGDGSGAPDIFIGDAIYGLTGRDYYMGSAVNGTHVYPEIIEITYDVQRQKQHLVTRDVRLAAMTG